MPKQSPTQREDRERNLLNAAYRLFISKGQLKTSVDDIVQEAQVAKVGPRIPFPGTAPLHQPKGFSPPLRTASSRKWLVPCR